MTSVASSPGSPHILVTGGAGFIGSHLVESLLGDGKRVVVIDDCSTGQRANLERVIRHPGLEFRQGKVSECADLPAIVKNAEYIFHLAAAVGVELVLNSCIATVETNLRETQVILRAAHLHRVPLLLTSTSEVYGKSQQPGFRESDDLLIGPPHLSRWSYACSKLMDEFLVLAYWKEHGLPVTIVRLFNTVGPRQTGRYGMVLPRFIAAAKRGDPVRVFGDGRQTRCFCYVGDVVHALRRLSESSQAHGEVFNVGSEDEISMRDLAQKVIQILGSRSEVEFVPYQKAYPAGFEDMLRRRPVTAKIQSAINFLPVTSLPEIIRLTAESL